MNAYIYCADIFCADCGRAIRKELRQQGKAPDDPRDESSYDSDEYPKGPFQDGGGEADSPQHCGAGADCLNAMEFDGVKVGAWLENPLTADGVEYVRQAIEDGGGLVASFWAEVYAEELS